MNCPKCDVAVDPAAAECPHCGVILAKATPEAFRPQRTPPPKPQPARPSSTSARQVAAAVVVIVALFLAIRHRRGTHAAETLPGWYADAGGYSRAMAEQTTTNKPVLVYFHTDWCGWCKKLDADIFRTGAFKDRYPSVIKVKINAERGAAERALTEQFGVRGYPTVVIVRAGQRAEPIVGYSEPDAYMARLDSLVN